MHHPRPIVALCACFLVLFPARMAVTQPEPEESDPAVVSVEALAVSLDEVHALMPNLLEGTHDEHLHTLNRMCGLTGAVANELQAIAQRLGERDGFDAEVGAKAADLAGKDLARAKDSCWRAHEYLLHRKYDEAGLALQATGEQIKSGTEWWEAGLENIAHVLNQEQSDLGRSTPQGESP